MRNWGQKHVYTVFLYEIGSKIGEIRSFYMKISICTVFCYKIIIKLGLKTRLYGLLLWNRLKSSKNRFGGHFLGFEVSFGIRRVRIWDPEIGFEVRQFWKSGLLTFSDFGHFFFPKDGIIPILCNDIYRRRLFSTRRRKRVEKDVFFNVLRFASLYGHLLCKPGCKTGNLTFQKMTVFCLLSLCRFILWEFKKTPIFIKRVVSDAW